MDSQQFEQELKDFQIDNDLLFDVHKNREFNEKVLSFYKRLLFNSRYVKTASYREQAKQYEKYDANSIDWKHVEKVLTMENKIANMNNCNSLWLLDVYELQKKKVFIKTNLCKDRFCNNCKKVKQALRMSRFIPKINEIAESVNMYHLTLSQPNCTGEDLNKNVKVMARSFARLIEYMKGKEKIAGINFKKYNYQGALRSLEVTYKKGNSFHPHYHVILALDFEDSEEKENINSFSMKHGQLVRKFSDTEILIQKVWRLLIEQEMAKYDTVRKINDESDEKKIKKLETELKKIIRNHPINKTRISELERGYSVVMDKFSHNHYYEVFKYMTKATNEGEEVFSYDNFIHLYFQLKGVRQIQGYGCFFRFKDDDSIFDDVDKLWNSIEWRLMQEEQPRVSAEFTKDLALDYTYQHISRNKGYSKYMREINEHEKKILEKNSLA